MLISMLENSNAIFRTSTAACSFVLPCFDSNTTEQRECYMTINRENMVMKSRLFAPVQLLSCLSFLSKNLILLRNVCLQTLNIKTQMKEMF